MKGHNLLIVDGVYSLMVSYLTPLDCIGLPRSNAIEQISGKFDKSLVCL